MAARRVLAGVMGYEAKNLQPPYRAPMATAWFPSMKKSPTFLSLSIGSQLALLLQLQSACAFTGNGTVSCPLLKSPAWHFLSPYALCPEPSATYSMPCPMFSAFHTTDNGPQATDGIEPHSQLKAGNLREPFLCQCHRLLNAELNPLRQGHLSGPIDSAGLSAHIDLPGI